MQVNIGPYVDWVGPYQVAQKLMFWVKKYEDSVWDDRVHALGEFFAYGFQKEANPHLLKTKRKPTWFYRLCEWYHKFKTRHVDIHIDDYDAWSADDTMALLILPILKKIKEDKMGSGFIDIADVPPHLQYTDDSENYRQMSFDFYTEEGTDRLPVDVHTRYDWVLDEMIWTFEQLQPDCDWEDQYRTGEIDFESVPCRWDDDGNPLFYTLEATADHTYKVDEVGRSAHQARINNGLRLFGKYFQTLWT